MKIKDLIKELQRRPDQNETIAVSQWAVEDVKSLDEGLTDAECIEVLNAAEHCHDANCGINWEVLQVHISNLDRYK